MTTKIFDDPVNDELETPETPATPAEDTPEGGEQEAAE